MLTIPHSMSFHNRPVGLRSIIARLRTLSLNVQAAFNKAWRYWKDRVPCLVRWAVYGALAGLGVFDLIHLVGFGAKGVGARTSNLPLSCVASSCTLTSVYVDTFAAMWHSSIGNVAARSRFAYMQRAGTVSVLSYLGIGAVVGVVVAVVIKAAAEGWSWISPRVRSWFRAARTD